MLSGTRIDNKCEVVRAVGQGAMGCVYEVVNTATGGYMALKMLCVPKGETEAETWRLELEA